jgi:hypothetical protein
MLAMSRSSLKKRSFTNSLRNSQKRAQSEMLSWTSWLKEMSFSSQSATGSLWTELKNIFQGILSQSQSTAKRRMPNLSKRRLTAEPLEARTLLSLSTVYVDDTLVWTGGALHGDLNNNSIVDNGDLVTWGNNEPGQVDNLLMGT